MAVSKCQNKRCQIGKLRAHALFAWGTVFDVTSLYRWWKVLLKRVRQTSKWCLIVGQLVILSVEFHLKHSLRQKWNLVRRYPVSLAGFDVDFSISLLSKFSLFKQFTTMSTERSRDIKCIFQLKQTVLMILIFNDLNWPWNLLLWRLGVWPKHTNPIFDTQNQIICCLIWVPTVFAYSFFL